MSTASEQFAQIYESRAWDSEVLSGPGSRPDANRRYLRFVQRLVNSGRIKSVLDVGCGDWSLGRHIDWKNVAYHGVDAVSSVVEENKRRFTGENVRFSQLDLIDDELPAADLLIVKDVLQHLPTRNVLAAIEKFNSFPMVLATNDRDRLYRYYKWRVIPRYVPFGAPPNSDTDVGGYRPLRLNEPPFNWKGVVQFRYRVGVSREIVDIKEVLLKENVS